MNNYIWYNNLNKSILTPPNYVFSLIWPILYIMLFTSLYIILKISDYDFFISPVYFFILQLILNFSWTTIFFKYKMIKFSLLIIISIIILTFITFNEFNKLNKLASYLLIPYIVWLIFATYLNTYIVINN